MKLHINRVASTCFYHIRRLRQLRFILTPSSLQRLVSALILSRLDYCNSILIGLPASTLAPLTRVLHAAARLVANLRHHDPISAALSNLHWLPVSYRIRYKICLLMYAAVHGTCPQYITDSLIPISSLPHRAHLRSSTSGDFDIPRVRTEFGKRAFSVAGPTEWNRLPTPLRLSPTIDIFKRNLKTFFFQLAYGGLVLIDD